MGRKLILDYEIFKMSNVNEGDLKSCGYTLKNIPLPCQFVAWAKPREPNKLSLWVGQVVLC
jgi:hypothetical protein